MTRAEFNAILQEIGETDTSSPQAQVRLLKLQCILLFEVLQHLRVSDPLSGYGDFIQQKGTKP